MIQRSLLDAILRHDEAGVREALLLGADANATDDKGCPVLFLAVCSVGRSDPGAVRALLDCGASPNCRNPNDGMTPLAVSAFLAKADIVGMLLRAGADPNAVDALTGKPVLYLAVEAMGGPSSQIVGDLLNAGASATAVGWTPAMTAIASAGRPSNELVSGLDMAWHFRDLVGRSALHLAVLFRRLDWVQVCLDASPRSCIRDDLGRSPLWYAADIGAVDILLLLLDKWPDSVEARDARGKTPLMAACSHGHLDICRLLLEHGAMIDSADIHGRVPLMHCRDSGREGEMLELLCEYGATLDKRDSCGDSVVAVGIKAHQARWTECLLNHAEGVSILRCDRDVIAPLLTEIVHDGWWDDDDPVVSRIRRELEG